MIAQPAIRSPRLLAGRTVGVTGLPSDSAVLRSVVAGSGGNARQVKQITIGFDAIPALLTRRVAAATAFWNDEGVVLQRRRPGYHVFRVDDYGAPAYPELVLCATRSSLRGDPNLAHAVVRALVRGYGVTLNGPEGSEADGPDLALRASRVEPLGQGWLVTLAPLDGIAAETATLSGCQRPGRGGRCRGSCRAP